MSITLKIGTLRPVIGEFLRGRQVFQVGLPYSLIADTQHCRLEVVAPSGDKTDLNSVPLFFNRVFPSQNYPAAAVLHDRMCEDKLAPSWLAAAVYWWVLRIERCPRWAAFPRWFAVRYFGPQFDGEPYASEYTSECGPTKVSEVEVVIPKTEDETP